jgi:hypothetical protein
LTKVIEVGNLVRISVPNKLLHDSIGYVVAADIYAKERERWFSIRIFDDRYGETPLDFCEREFEVIP